MQVALLDYTRDAEEAIATAAAVCYGTDTTPDANARRIQKLLQSGHLSPLRFAYASFRVMGVSRVESHQHVRVAHAGVLQRSQRYTQATRQVVTPPSFASASAECQELVRVANAAAFTAYDRLLSESVPKEDARYVLPQGSVTEFVMTGNFHMWHNWLHNRANQQAQWEIRQVAQLIHAHLSSIAPNVFPSHYPAPVC